MKLMGTNKLYTVTWQTLKKGKALRWSMIVEANSKRDAVATFWKRYERKRDVSVKDARPLYSFLGQSRFKSATSHYPQG